MWHFFKAILFILNCSFSLLIYSKEPQVFPKFDFKTYQEQREKLSKESNDSGIVSFIGKNGNQFEIISFGGGFAERETSESKDFIYYREYSEDGDLLVEGKLAALESAKDVRLGQWNTYSNNKLVKSEDNEQGFKVSFKKVLEICKSKNIDLNHRLSSINRSKAPQHPLWYISYSSNETKPSSLSSKENPVLAGIPVTIIRRLSIDGVTGELKELKNSRFIDN